MSTGSAPLHQEVLVAQSALDTTHAGLFVPHYNVLRLLIVGSAGISAGAVVLEAAHAPSYAGTWLVVVSATTAVADSIVSGASLVTAAFPYVRARISTAIVGGTVTVWVVGN